MAALLTTDEAAQRVGVSVSTLLKYLHMGRLVLAKRGEHGRIYLCPLEVERWIAWYEIQRAIVKRRRQLYAGELARANGMMVAGKLKCEETEGVRRERLFNAARGLDRAAAISALSELHQKYYGLRLPLEERRLGIDLGGQTDGSRKERSGPNSHTGRRETDRAVAAV